MTSTITLDPEWFNTYWPSFRQHAHELLAWGYKDARSEIGQVHEEEDITELIKAAIQERLEAFDCPRWCEHYTVHEEEPVPGIGRKGKHRKKTDLAIEMTKFPRPRYVFEAKPLREDRNFREGYYFGTGIKRFLQGEYASKYLEAGMIGYVQYATEDAWIGRLKRYLIKDAQKKDCKLRLKSSPRDEQIIDAFPKEWISEHIREAGNEIVIYHILLDCCYSGIY